MSDDYIHGRDPHETERLETQAAFIAGVLLDRLEVPREANTVLDLGCGVGAMTRRLIDRGAVHPIGVDRSAWQVAEAKRLTPRGSASFAAADAATLPFRNDSFDLVFTSWLFEHVPDVPAALEEVRRVLVPGGVVWGAEVENASLIVWPASPALEMAFAAFNASQVALHGDPFIGRKMYSLLKRAGFQADVWPHTFHGHAGRPEAFQGVVQEFTEIIRSARESVVERAGRLDAATYDRAIEDLARLPDTPGATLTYTFMRFYATKERRGRR